jgi:hypothetical protein
MVCSERAKNRMRRMVGGVTIGVVFVTMAACSSNQPKPMAQPTPDQVRGHADRGFDKLKQDEQEHGTQSPVPR